jgi:hypothetical protein
VQPPVHACSKSLTSPYLRGYQPASSANQSGPGSNRTYPVARLRGAIRCSWEPKGETEREAWAFLLHGKALHQPLRAPARSREICHLWRVPNISCCLYPMSSRSLCASEQLGQIEYHETPHQLQGGFDIFRRAYQGQAKIPWQHAKGRAALLC